MFCKNCGAKLNPTDKFCQNCGTPVPAGPAMPPPPPVYAVPPTQPVYPAQPSPAPVPGYGYPPMDPLHAQKVQTAQRMIAKYRGKWVFPCIAFFVLMLLGIILTSVGAFNYDALLVSLGWFANALSGLFFLLWLIFAIILNVNKKIIRQNR